MIQKVEITPKTIIFTVFFLLSLQILWTVKELIFGLFFAFIFMSALKPVVLFFEKARVPRAIAVILSIISAVSILVFLISFAFPPLISEAFIFFKNLPHLIKGVMPTVSQFINFESLNKFLPEITQNTVGIISGVFSNYFFVISVLFFSFYFLLDDMFFKNVFKRFLEEKEAERIYHILEKTEERMSAWMWGELKLMTIIGVLSYIGLSFLGVKYAFSLAVIAGLLEIVPVIGPVTSVIPAFIVAASTSWFLGLSVLPLYFIIQQLENNLIVPLVMQTSVGIHPIMTLIALTIGGKLGGVLGVLLAVPIALFVETTIVEYSKKKK